MFIEGEIPNVVTTTGGNNNGGFMNGDGWWAIILFALIFGYGRNGFGGFGGFGGGSGIGENYVLATDFATIERKLDAVNNGICDSTFALNNTITTGNFNTINAITQAAAGLNTALVQGFNGVDNAICTLGYQNQAGFNQIGNLIQSCCCDLKAINLENRYLNEKQTCEIVNAINAGNQRLVDIYTNDKLDALRTENASLKGQISNDRQSRFIIDELRSGNCPVPAYVVQPSQPVTFPTDCCGTVNYARNNSCGCC